MSERPQRPLNNPVAVSPLPAFPAAPPDLRSRNVFRYLKFYGPGAILASVTVGTGETVFASRGGAIFGYSLLWCLACGALFKGVQTYAGLRFIVLTGQHPVAVWARLPGPRGWFPISLALMSTITLATVVSALPKTLASLLVSVAGVGPSEPSYALAVNALATGCLVICALAALGSSYRVLEAAQTAIIAVFVLLALAAFVAIRPDITQLAGGLLIPSLPPYPDWIQERYPAIARRSVWIEVLTYFGMIGGSAADYLAYVSFARDKRWGLAGGATMAATSPAISPADANAARTWLRAPIIDVILSFSMLLVVTMVFVVLGAALLAPQRVVPHESALLTVQARFLTDLHPGLFPVYVLGIIAVFGGTIYGVFEVQARAIDECWRSLRQDEPGNSDADRIPSYRQIRKLLVILGLALGTLLIWTNWDPVAIITPASLLAGVFACGLWCFAIVWAEKRAVSADLRMPLAARLLLLAAGTAMTIAGARAIADYVRGIW